MTDKEIAKRLFAASSELWSAHRALLEAGRTAEAFTVLQVAVAVPIDLAERLLTSEYVQDWAPCNTLGT